MIFARFISDYLSDPRYLRSKHHKKYEEHNARIHVVVAILVIVVSFVLQIDKFEWLVIILSIAMVITAEIFNSAIEYICDYISPGKQETIKRIKDLSAAAILLTSLIAMMIGVIVFISKL